MSKTRPILILLAAFLAAVLVVDPRGNFPLDDDWGVGYTTFTLVQTGRIQFTPFASATAYLQFVWGALWASVFGETFTVLRMSTLALSLASTLLTYLLLRRAQVRRELALFGAAALLFHPLFFWASFTSMTHVPFVFLSIVALWMFVLAAEREGVWLALAFVATVASFFTRQFAILNALVPLIVALLARRKKLAATYAGALVVFGLLAASGVLVGSAKELALHRPTIAGLAMRAVHYVYFNWQSAALFFAAPLLLVSLTRPRLSRVTLVTCGIAFALVAWRMTMRVGMPIPYMNSGNVFTDFGLGPPTLRDVFTLRMPHPFALPWSIKVALMIVTTIGAALAASLTIASLRENDLLVRYCAIYLLCGTLIAAGMSIYFDRYSIDTAWPLVLLLVLLANRAQITRPASTVAAIVLSIMIVFAISGTAEYLAWNRARWDAYAFLRANGVTLEEMDGGYEINALLALRAGRKDLGNRGVGVLDDRYILTFNRDVPGYEVLRSFPYRRWFGLSEGAIHALRRAP
ncbi:MAG TPA: glycosyltransferase family 39 protein [Thermoanaerobaculia bacterium]|nr:glycosyltransferase family 39 protein [Thermoanaerobaculia bacterium]